MLAAPRLRSLGTFEDLSPRAMDSVLETARALQRAWLAGQSRALLRGRRLGLISDRPDSDDAALFRRAASELGAHVALVRPAAADLASPAQVQRMAQMLGRLYDALECHGLPAALVRQLGSEASVPVFEGIALSSHPTAQLAGLLDDATPAAENRRFVLQAMLVSALA